MAENGGFQEMQRAIGSLLWLWVSIERCAEALDPAPLAATGHVPFHSFAARLDRWERKLELVAAAQPFRIALAQRLLGKVKDARRIRNGICHGLHGIEGADDTRPGRLVWRQVSMVGSTEESMTWDALQAHFAWLSKVPGALGILDRNGTEGFSRVVDTAENRVWWAAEYGIDLPV